MSVISLKNINKSFGDHVIFKDYSLDIEQGDYLAIMGESGKGKTTLLNIIGLLEKPDNGTLKIKEIENPRFGSKKGIKLLRNNISYLFQNFGLMDSETVKENLKVSTRFKNLKKSEENQKISEVLKQVGLEGFEKRKVFELSGGEQQRVALAKIILKDSDIILADEPTGSLDAENRDHVMNILSELNTKNKTIIIVTHDPAVSDMCDKVINL